MQTLTKMSFWHTDVWTLRVKLTFQLDKAKRSAKQLQSLFNCLLRMAIKRNIRTPHLGATFSQDTVDSGKKEKNIPQCSYPEVLTVEPDAADSGVRWEPQVQRERVASLP